MNYIRYKGKGEHSVAALEQIIEQREKELHEYKTRDIAKNPVTIWQRWNEKKQRYEHNHIEEGHVHTFRPVPQSAEQRKAWEHAQWNRKWVYMYEMIANTKL